MSSRTFCALGAWVIAMLIAPVGAGASSVVFTDYESIYSVGADGTGLRAISQKNAGQIAVSPNGKQLAYTHGSLYAMPLSGKKRKPMDLLKRYPTVRNLAGAYYPSWSPNGKQLVFAGANDGRLYIIKSNGKGLRYLLGKTRVVGYGHPIWSPTGDEIFFTDGADGSDLKAVDLRTGAERVVYPGDGPAGTVEDFDVSPDGQRIAFYAPYRNWMINVDGTGLRQISPPNGYFVSYEGLSFSPDGSELAGAYDGEVWALDGEHGADEGSGGYTRLLTAELPGPAFDTDWLR
jgi:Tol biopolymer transport system component